MSLPILPSAQSQLKKDGKGMKMVGWFLDKARFVKEVLEPEANASGGSKTEAFSTSSLSSIFSLYDMIPCHKR